MANPTDKIIIKGARQHNLKDIDVTIPRDKLVVIHSDNRADYRTQAE